MPPYAKNSENRWLHPTYRKAYCYRYQNGLVYTSVNSVRKATGFIWDPKNKKMCMKILNARINDYFNKTIPNTQIKFIKDLIIQFHRDKVTKLNPITQKHYKTIYRQFLNFDMPLSEVQAIRAKIIETKNLAEIAELKEIIQTKINQK